ncbi:hypothetical protein D9756_011635 [Leucocoprinus leucothites]|uniref:Uncharacterized protein n=1 Tax=Leucocoprinus leucothites TaxID=201217 RepID=A0A8H5FND2_9AGAR|nr:hypothetical protein D9756_011635 [Leucoagaricus leucothites]
MASATIIIYETARAPSRSFEVPVPNGRLSFSQNVTFCAQTGYPHIALSMYDIRLHRFIEIGTFVSVEVDTKVDNFLFIVRRAHLSDSECLELSNELKKLCGDENIPSGSSVAIEPGSSSLSTTLGSDQPRIRANYRIGDNRTLKPDESERAVKGWAVTVMFSAAQAPVGPRRTVYIEVVDSDDED